ncbi:MAG: non-hydrolyzing UDP-N-acetylglucosamine 2-epimerase [Bacteroidales bacterium]
MKLLTIIGARPQIIKAAAISRAIQTHYNDQIHEVIVHTGQHYDKNMSEIFLSELGIPTPTYNLEVGSGNHGIQTSKIIIGIEELLIKEKPDYCLIYGDTNSTIAGAIAASKLHIPVVHIEAGLRSFNKNMPEEINRIATDHVSTLLFTPTKTGYKNLLNEGFKTDLNFPFDINKPGVFQCGDIMLDNSLYFAKVAEKKSDIITNIGVGKGEYILATIHRDHNTDDAESLNTIFSSFLEIVNKNKISIILPLHPRTKKRMNELMDKDIHKSILNNKFIHLIPPTSFLEMIALEKHAKLIMTDSGGVQKEAYFFSKPCIILRPETEWVEIIEQGSAILCKAHKDDIISAFTSLNATHKKLIFPKIFGDGRASEFILETLIENSKKQAVI